jgi:hypothetical protein
LDREGNSWHHLRNGDDSTPIVGREAELREVDRFLDAARS